MIFGNETLGIPAMGVVGAAYATVITRVVEFLIIMIFTFKIQKRLAIIIKDLFRHDKVMWRDYAKYGLPIMAGDTQWGFVNFFKAVLIGRGPENMIAANGIAEPIMSLMGIFTIGLGSAACVIIGKSVGAGEYDKTRQYSNTLQILFASFGILASAILFFSRGALVSLYEIMDRGGGFEADTKALAMTFLAIGSVTLIGTFYHATCFTGINRGSGDGKFVFKVDMICGWVIVLPLTFLNVVILGSSAPVIFLFSRIDQCFKWLIAFIRLRGDKWIRNVTR
jgi:Na+-driven multidrug efflux pump